MAWIDGARLGQSIVSSGFDEYYKMKKYQDDLKASKAEGLYKSAKLKLEEDEASQKLLSQTIRDRQDSEKMKETKRHNEAMEGIYAGRGNKPPTGKDKGLTGGQAAQALIGMERIGERSPDYFKDPANWDQRENLRAVATPGYQKRPFPKEEPSWYQKALTGMFGSGSQPEALDDDGRRLFYGEGR